MKLITTKNILFAMIAVMALTSCSKHKSYAELLTKENQDVNLFLCNHRVSETIPTDTNFIFETGPDAPYYPLDQEGNMYMQVINPGTRGNYAADDEIIYFRFTRYSLSDYNGTLPSGWGNEEDMETGNYWFRYKNFSINASSQWGAGVQMPLHYLPIDSEVNIIIKSQYGFTEELSYVLPFLYRLRYYKLRT